MKIALMMAISVALAFGTQARAAGGYRYTSFSIPGAEGIDPVGINDSGTVAGYYYVNDPVTSLAVYHGFVYSGGVLSTFDPPGSTGTIVRGIANDGSVYGSFAVAGTKQRMDAFVLTRGTYATFGHPGFQTALTCASADGTAAGYSAPFDNTVTRLVTYAFGKFAIKALALNTFYPTAINNSATTIGTANRTSTAYMPASFIITRGHFSPLDGAASAALFPAAINNAGTVVGLQGNIGFMLGDGVLSAVQYPTRPFTQVYGINAAGDIVGEAEGGTQSEIGFLLHAGRYVPINPPGAVAAGAIAINKGGQVLGDYTAAGDRTGAIFIATPN